LFGFIAHFSFGCLSNSKKGGGKKGKGTKSFYLMEPRGKGRKKKEKSQTKGRFDEESTQRQNSV